MRVTKMLTEKFIFVFIFFGLAFVEERFMRSKCTCFCFFKTVNCQTVTLVTQKKKFVFGNCQLSTVTLGDGVIDLSCDMMKNKAQKIWNISLLVVYLQRK